MYKVSEKWKILENQASNLTNLRKLYCIYGLDLFTIALTLIKASKGKTMKLKRRTAMTREEITKMMIEFAAMAFNRPAETITEDTNIADELGVASSQRIAMSASIENEFDVMIPVARFGKFETIRDLVDFVMDEM